MDEQPFAQIVPYGIGTSLRSPPAYCCPLCQRPFLSAGSTFGAQYFRDLPSETMHNTTTFETAGYYDKYFVETLKLGHGSFGGVYVCRHVVEGVSLGLFAVKKIPIGEDAEYFLRVVEEVRMLEEVRRHPNVIEYNHCWIDYAQVADFGPVTRCLFVLMEYATEGPLDLFLRKHGEVLSDTAVWYFFLSAVSGLSHLHSKGIVHRDLKPQNLLLTFCEGRPPRLMLSDFGTASLLGRDSQRLGTGATGTLDYEAPELTTVDDELTNSGCAARAWTRASDMWAMGMILHYLAFECALPEQVDPLKIAAGVQQRPPHMVALIGALLSVDPRMRPSCDNILGAPFVQNFLAAFECGRWGDVCDLPSAAQRPLLTDLHASLSRKESVRSVIISTPVDAGPSGLPTPLPPRRQKKKKDVDAPFAKLFIGSIVAAHVALFLVGRWRGH